MGRERDTDSGRPVDPGAARTYGNDPHAVEFHRSGEHPKGLGPDIPKRTEPMDRRESEEEFASRGTANTTVGTSSSTGGRRLKDDERQGGGSLAPARRDSVRWGPVWAGLITALTTFLLLQLLAIGAGLVDIGPGSQGGGGWVPALIGLIAFFTGGVVAGMTSAIRGTGSGLLNGFMVWALGTVLILLLSVLGLGQLFGALGNVAGQIGPGALSNAANSAQNAAPNVSPQEAEQTVRTGAIGAFFGLLFSALASALGGYLGGRSSNPIGRPTDLRSER